MFHSGEVIGYQAAGDDGMEDYTVITGWCDWPVRRMVFDPGAEDGSPLLERVHPAGVLAVLLRQSDGRRFLLEAGTFALCEQADGRSLAFDWREEREAASQFDDAAGRAYGRPSVRTLHVGGRTLREPTVEDD